MTTKKKTDETTNEDQLKANEVFIPGHGVVEATSIEEAIATLKEGKEVNDGDN